MFEALFEGKKVEVVDQYEGVWIYRFPGDPTGRQGIIQKFTDLQGRPLNGNPPSANPATPSIPAFPPSPTSTPISVLKSEPETQTVLINYLSKTELQKTLKGISKLHASKVYERRPYQSWENLIEVNGDLPVDWAAVKEDLEVVLDFTLADKP